MPSSTDADPPSPAPIDVSHPVPTPHESRAPEAAEPRPSRRKGGRAARQATFEAILMTGGLLLFLAMLWSTGQPAARHAFLNPLLLGAVAALLLWPLRDERTARTLLLATGAVLSIWLLDVLGGVLLPFVLVFMLASLFNPVVVLAQERWRIPRGASSAGVTLIVLGLVGLVVFQLVPNLAGELERLALRSFESLEAVRDWLATTPVLDAFEQAGLLDRAQLVAEVTQSVQALSDSASGNLPALVRRLVSYVSSLLGIVMVAGVLPVVLYYTLKDYPFIKRRLVGLFPTFGGRRDYLLQAGEVVGSYLRGQLLISAIAAVNVTVALVLFDVPFALLIGLVAGVFNMIPSIGAILTAVVGVTVAVVFGDPWLWTALTVLGVLAAQNLLEQSVLTPKILSRQMGLHPVLILLSLFVFGYFLGFLGLVVAVPVTALIMTTYKAYRDELTLELSSDARLKRDLARRLFARFRQEETGDP